MRYLILLLLLGCGPLFLLAQENDPIDDEYVQIYQTYKQKLNELGYPVGRAGNAAWVLWQYNLRYEGANAAAEFDRDLSELKRVFGAPNVKVLGECGCSDEFRIYNIEVTVVGGEEKGKAGKERVAQTIGQEEVEPNFYVVPELEQLNSNPPYNTLPPNFAVISSGKPAAPVNIAVLDTGIDPYYQDPQVTGGRAPLYLWENPAPNDPDDPFCYDDDLIGWDFINNDNAPLDDHSHGTHVTSRIAEQLQNNAPDVNYRFMALKMLDQAGVGTTFHASCAVAYAAKNGADVINASWGFYGERDAILYKTFKYAQAQGVATMNSAGNYRRDLSEVKHYPSDFALESSPLRGIFFVSATRTGTQLWPLTNFRSSTTNTPQ
jgi:subtilisin family serine protease